MSRYTVWIQSCDETGDRYQVIVTDNRPSGRAWWASRQLSAFSALRLQDRFLSVL